MMTIKVRFWRLLGLIFAINLIAACTTNTPSNGLSTPANSALNPAPSQKSYQGRLSIRIAAETPQSLYGAFTISGDAQTGELTLNSPLGNTVAKLAWTPRTALLVANNTTTNYPSTEALIANVTGTALPLPALFDWLAGINTPIDGWEVDLSNMQNADNRRLIAKRTNPLPAVDLRIALEQP